MNTTLVVMAAGMGSRFGGLKQMTPVGPSGEFLMDFSAYDAKEAGFNKVVFVIKKEMEADFNKIVGERVKKYIDVDYVFQTTDDLPEGRQKPWGTGHAILCCRDKVDTPFAIINADDYYGKAGYVEINNFLQNAKSNEFAMVGYDLNQTTTDNGTVTRGICQIKDGFLDSIRETSGIKDSAYCEDGVNVIPLPEDTVVSMNLWGFTPEIFEHLDNEFKKFKAEANLLKDEFLIPSVVDTLIKNGTATVKMLRSADRWYGMTYRDDLETVKEAMKNFCDKGMYNSIS